MNEFLTPQDIIFALAVFGAIASLWWRVEAKIDKAKQKAEDAERALDKYKTHVAETYVTKDGLREQFAQVMRGMDDLKRTIDHVATRVDSLVDEHRASPSRRRSGASE